MARSRVFTVRFTDADVEALKAAAAVYRRRTGAIVTPSDLIRWGAAAFTYQLGHPMSEGIAEVKN
jgi:hypothetical protein